MTSRRYDNPVTESFVTDRLSFLDQTAKFRRIDLYWCLTLEPAKANPFERKPKESAVESSRMLAQLKKTAEILETNLAGTIGIRLLGTARHRIRPFTHLRLLSAGSGLDRTGTFLQTSVSPQVVRARLSIRSPRTFCPDS